MKLYRKTLAIVIKTISTVYIVCYRLHPWKVMARHTFVFGGFHYILFAVRFSVTGGFYCFLVLLSTFLNCFFYPSLKNFYGVYMRLISTLSKKKKKHFLLLLYPFFQSAFNCVLYEYLQLY